VWHSLFRDAAVFETLATALFHSGGQIRQRMLEALQQALPVPGPAGKTAFESLKKRRRALPSLWSFGLVSYSWFRLLRGALLVHCGRLPSVAETGHERDLKPRLPQAALAAYMHRLPSYA